MPALGVKMASISTSSLAACSRRVLGRRRVAAFAVAGTLSVALGAGAWSAAPRFYPDDPVWTDDDRAFDASKVVAIEDTNGYDFIVNSFTAPGERRDVRALN